MTRLTPLLLAMAALVSPPAPSSSEDRADLILQHGVFYPVQPSGTSAGTSAGTAAGRIEGSLAVRGGRIVYLGPDAGALAFKGPATRLVDLGGRAVTPGLIDAHLTSWVWARLWRRSTWSALPPLRRW